MIHYQKWKNVSLLPLHKLRGYVPSMAKLRMFGHEATPASIFLRLTKPIWKMIKDQTNAYLRDQHSEGQLLSNGYSYVEEEDLAVYYVIRRMIAMMKKGTIEDSFAQAKHDITKEDNRGTKGWFGIKRFVDGRKLIA